MRALRPQTVRISAVSELAHRQGCPDLGNLRHDLGNFGAVVIRCRSCGERAILEKRQVQQRVRVPSWMHWRCRGHHNPVDRRGVGCDLCAAEQEHSRAKRAGRRRAREEQEW